MMKIMHKEYEYPTGNWRLVKVTIGKFSAFCRWLFGKDTSTGYDLMVQVEMVTCFRNIYGDWQELSMWVNPSVECLLLQKQYRGIADGKTNKWIAKWHEETGD